MFLLCLLAGCSICWFNTVCFILCIRNFPANRPLALSLTVSFNGVSAALYALAGNSIDPSSSALYLLLNALVPLIVSIAALVPILRQPTLDPLPTVANRRDSLIFLLLNVLALLTGVYLLLFGSNTSNAKTARLLFSGSIFLLIFPLCIPGVVYARDWFHRTVHSSFRLEDSGFILVEHDDLELHKQLLSRENSKEENGFRRLLSDGGSTRKKSFGEIQQCCDTIIWKDRLAMLGEEHSARLLVSRLDFWLYYLAYFCGGTVGLVYSDNLGKIAQSLGQSSNTTSLLTLYTN